MSAASPRPEPLTTTTLWPGEASPRGKERAASPRQRTSRSADRIEPSEINLNLQVPNLNLKAAPAKLSVTSTPSSGSPRASPRNSPRASPRGMLTPRSAAAAAEKVHSSLIQLDKTVSSKVMSMLSPRGGVMKPPIQYPRPQSVEPAGAEAAS
eukprot:CAMPEP_0181219998 /NCGR_PEP_ID=MMETSP1096-20121128/28597_1 /TAXON_ID=156174 ORGANISM="Chrysochromulina ericina, Strain CCMP281" /NCGR_SAMPLE_ID=MMETSP1096 /ASSEMBLY_ACC=CAM_ASM_000453 /LENGTH=152 /DNA_ID=CAMNT_0023312461 /DNA_START=78 /DNA_END=536 /DNA_ORIENTATION=+